MTIKSLRLATLTLFLAATARVHAAIPAAENLLPSDTLGFFTVPDCSVFRADAKVSPQIMFWNDPAMKPFHDKFMDKLNELYLAPLEKDLGLHIADFAGLPQGQLTLAFTANGSTGHDDTPPGVILLLDARNQSDVLKTNLATLVKKWTDNGRTLRTEKIHDLNFTVITLSSNDLAGILPHKAPVSEIGVTPKPDKPVEIYFTQYQSLLIAATSPTVAEVAAARLTGGNLPVIADDATFAADKLSHFRENPTYYGWLNARLLVSEMMQTPDDPGDSTSPMSNFSISKMAGVLGLSNLKSLAMAMRESHDGSFLSFHATTSDDAPTGVLKILALAPKDSGPPPFVPADAIKFSRVRINGKQAWTEIQKMAAAISPTTLAGINSVIDIANSGAQQKDPGFDLRNALFGNLGDDFISYQKPPVGNSLTELAAPPAISLVASPNPDQVVQSIQMIAMMIAQQNPAPPREFMGHKIYSVNVSRPQRTATGGTVTPPPLLMSSANGYAVFSPDEGILDDFLRSSDGKVKPLADSPGLADAIQRVGGSNGGLLSYQNQREAMRTTFRLVKDANDSDLLMKVLPPAIHDLFDFSLLPDFDTVSKYFYITVFAGSTTPTGTTINVYTPRPPQLN